MYVDDFDEEYRDDEIYQMKKREGSVRPVFQEIELEPREITKEVTIKQRQAVPKWPEEEIQPLKTLGANAIGSLFDRVDFLEARIKETKDNLDLRRKIHNEITKEIDTDIEDKREIEIHLTDWDEKRNFKLDISILRREKRQENVQFWRDMVELNNELKELIENHRMETKILGIFKNLRGVEDVGS